jgi:hypothetical protein
VKNEVCIATFNCTVFVNKPPVIHRNFGVFRMASGPPGLNQVGVFARANISPDSTTSQLQRGPLHSNKKRALVVDGKTLT